MMMMIFSVSVSILMPGVRHDTRQVIPAGGVTASRIWAVNFPAVYIFVFMAIMIKLNRQKSNSRLQGGL